jgi:hypothetical protein
MTKCIVYQGEGNSVSIVFPAPDCGLTVEQIALKDVPFGKPFKIIDIADLPTDQSTRNAWVVDETDLTDGVGADYGIGSDNPFVMPEATQ